MTQVLIDRVVLERYIANKQLVSDYDKLRAALEAKPVEPVANGRVLITKAYLTYLLSLEEKVARLSAPPQHATQETIDKSKLKRLVTQVFGEGYEIVPPATMHAGECDPETAALGHTCSRGTYGCMKDYEHVPQ